MSANPGLGPPSGRSRAGLRGTRAPFVPPDRLLVMEPRAELHVLIDRLSDEDVLRLLDYVNNLTDPDTLTDDEMAELLVIEAEMEAGEYVTLAEFKEKYGA